MHQIHRERKKMSENPGMPEKHDKERANMGGDSAAETRVRKLLIITPMKTLEK